MRVQYSPERIPKWVGDFSNTKEYRGYLHSIGIALPDESGDVTMGEADSPVFDSPDLGGDSGVSEGIPVDTPSTSVANHTQSLPSTTSQPYPPTTTHPSPPTPTHEKPSPKPRKKPLPATEKAPSSPIVEAKEEPLPGPNINERVRAGEATLVEPELTKAHQVVMETLSGSQPHDPNALHLPNNRAMKKVGYEESELT